MSDDGQRAMTFGATDLAINKADRFLSKEWLDKLDHIVVITQMHAHYDYVANEFFRYVDESYWRTLFNSRCPSPDGDDNGIGEHMAIDDDRIRLTSATVGPDTSAGMGD